MPFGIAVAALQEIMPNSMRGQTTAVYSLVIILLGLGVAPTAVALVTDFGFSDDKALRYSLLIVTSAALVFSSMLLSEGLRPYRESLVNLQTGSPTYQRYLPLPWNSDEHTYPPFELRHDVHGLPAADQRPR
jgi:TRAP-type C4-dicarboxylate transport system permease small subunit